MLQNAPHRADQDARALRERLELAVLGDDDRACAEAARALVAFCDEHPEYRVCQLVTLESPSESAAEAPRRIASKYLARCKTCNLAVLPGEECLWTPGEKGVLCLKCGGKL